MYFLLYDYIMDEEIKEVALEELLDKSFVITEEKLVGRITEKELEKYTKIRNDIEVNKKTGLSVSFYIKENHLLDQFEKRFTTGEDEVNKRLDGKFKFKDLPKFTPYSFKKFKEVYFNGF